MGAFLQTRRGKTYLSCLWTVPLALSNRCVPGARLGLLLTGTAAAQPVGLGELADERGIMPETLEHPTE